MDLNKAVVGRKSSLLVWYQQPGNVPGLLVLFVFCCWHRIRLVYNLVVFLEKIGYLGDVFRLVKISLVGTSWL